MSNLLIHDVSKELKARLQEDALRHGRSVDEHARILLATALGLNPAVGENRADIEHIELVVDHSPNAAKGLREHTRVEFGDIKARFSSDASTKLLGLFTRYFSCEIADISVRGACIRSNKPLSEHESITLYFQHAGKEKITIAAKVVRARQLGAKQFEYGVQFLDVMPQGDLRSIICQKVIEQKFH